MAYRDYDEWCINGKLMYRVQPDGEWTLGRAPLDARSICYEPAQERKQVLPQQPPQTGREVNVLPAVALGMAAFLLSKS